MKKQIFALLIFGVITVCFVGSTYAQDTYAQEMTHEQKESGSAESSSSVDSNVPTPNTGPLAPLASCTWWWIYGQNSWSWHGLPPLYATNNSSGTSTTTYGTSTGSCGTPLIVDRIYVRVIEYPLNDLCCTRYDKTAYNTSAPPTNIS